MVTKEKHKKTENMKFKWVFFFLMIGLILAGCEREQEIELPEATVVIENYNGNAIVQEPAGEVELSIVSQSLAGIKKLEVLANESVIETLETEERFTHRYGYTYRVAKNARTGDEVRLIFRMEDRRGRTVSSPAVIIRVDEPFRIVDFVRGGHTFRKIYGRINKDLTLTKKEKWLVDSIVSVDQGATLTIDPGTTVYFRTFSNSDKLSLLSVMRGGKIVAEGTRTEPIVFTSDKTLSGNPVRGDWGGVSIHGNAPTNAGKTVLRDGFRYGGTHVSDNSGRLRFVRIEYAGKKQYHALQLFGVGSGTKLEYVQVFECHNNAFRMRGGRVSLKYISGIQHGGYGIWADEGWQGNGQFWLFQTGIKATLIPVNYWNQARSIEFRNDDSFYEKEPRTTFKLSNLTLIGNGYAEGGDHGTRRGIRIRTGAQGLLHNAIVTQFPSDAVRVEDLPIESLGSSMLIDNMRSYDNLANWEQEAKDYFFKSNRYNLKETPVGGISIDDFTGIEPSPYNPAAMSSWFTSASYIGAVDSKNDWTAGGSWFKNKDGSFR